MSSQVPVIYYCVEQQQLPYQFSQYKDTLFITKLLWSPHTKSSSDPISGYCRYNPPPNHPSGPIPQDKWCIISIVGKWADIRHQRYNVLTHKISHVHNAEQDPIGLFDALQEMGRHIDACFTHKISIEMINSGLFSSKVLPHFLQLGLISHVDRSTPKHHITVIVPSQQLSKESLCSFLHGEHDIIDIYNQNSKHRATPFPGWLCIFALDHDDNTKYSFVLPIVDLTSNSRSSSITTPNRRFENINSAIRIALLYISDKWYNHNTSVKRISAGMPHRLELNPYSYVKMWDEQMKQYELQKQYQKLQAQQRRILREELSIKIMQLQRSQQEQRLASRIVQHCPQLKDILIATSHHQHHSTTTKQLVNPDIIRSLSNGDGTAVDCALADVFYEGFAEFLPYQLESYKIGYSSTALQHEQFLVQDYLGESTPRDFFVQSLVSSNNTLFELLEDKSMSKMKIDSTKATNGDDTTSISNNNNHGLSHNDIEEAVPTNKPPTDNQEYQFFLLQQQHNLLQAKYQILSEQLDQSQIEHVGANQHQTYNVYETLVNDLKDQLHQKDQEIERLRNQKDDEIAALKKALDEAMKR